MTNNEAVPIPTRWLLGASGILVAVGAAFVAAVLGDGGFINAHGLGGLWFMVFAVTALITGVLELVAIGVSLQSMLRAPGLRTKANTAALLIGTIPIIAVCWLFLWRGM